MDRGDRRGKSLVAIMVILLLLLFVLVFFFVLVAQEESDDDADAGAAANHLLLLLGNFRRRSMVGTHQGNSTASPQVSPSPGPNPPSQEVEEKERSHSPPTNLAALDPPLPKNTTTNTTKVVDPTPTTTMDPKQQHHQDDHLLIDDDKCDPSSNKCTVESRLVACLRKQSQQHQTGDREFYLLVQNEGESSLKVNIDVPASVKIEHRELQIPKHQAQKINVSVNVGESPKIILNAGYGDCVLKPEVVMQQNNFLQQIPSYATLVTPIYGAYFSFLIVVIVGGAWACCWYKKRGPQQGNGIPYQELEMGVSGSAVNVETADGWDQGWDDDWDDDNAVKSPGGQHVGNVSANGLTSRSSSKDGWGNDWDD